MMPAFLFCAPKLVYFLTYLNVIIILVICRARDGATYRHTAKLD